MSDAKKILVVSAHAVDWLWRAGGTIANYVKAGATVKVIDLSTGVNGESVDVWRSHPGITEEGVDKIRKEEVAAAAAALGIAEVEHFDLKETHLMMSREDIMRLGLSIRKFNPDIVLTHAQFDPKNTDHETAYKATLTAVTCAAVAEGVYPADIPNAKKAALYSFEPDLPELSGFKPDVYIDISDSYDVKLKAMNCIKSQPYMIPNYELRSKVRGTQCKRFQADPVLYAEAFQRIFPTVGLYF